MQGRLVMVCLAAVLAVTPTWAQTTPTPAPEPTRLSYLQSPGDIDARLMLNADILLAFVNVGVAVDVGMARMGPGVLSLGGEFELGACFTFCLVLNAITGWEFSNLYYSPHARLAYHVLPGSLVRNDRLDLYGVLIGGVTLTTTRVGGTAEGTKFDYKGSDVGPSLGLGVGVKFFPQEGLFFGAEARLRYAAGIYTYTARVGNVSISDTQAGWSLSGLNVQLFAGLRL